jgi:hypothetical protein
MGNVCGGPPKEQGRGKPVDLKDAKVTVKPADVSQSTDNMGSK